MSVSPPVGSAAPFAYRYGCHRVLQPHGSLPQAAWQLDNRPRAPGDPVAAHELVIAVERLNVDAASFLQMEAAAKSAGEDLAAGVKARIFDTVGKRGKLHNPVTGSGGMLLGRVARVGGALPEPFRSLAVGEKVATLVSLSLTPLYLESLDALGEVSLASHQVAVRPGTEAVLFASGSFARLPDFLSEKAALSALDVAGAGPQVARLCTTRRLRRILILGGGGKSGLLCAAAARQASGSEPGRASSPGEPIVLIGVEQSPRSAEEARRLGYYDRVLELNATDPLKLAAEATEAAGGEFDLVVSCVSVPGAEVAAILCCKDRGIVYYFSMATSFTAAALGAEGVGKDVDLLIGNGYCEGHADATLELLRRDDGLRALFEARYGGAA